MGEDRQQKDRHETGGKAPAVARQHLHGGGGQPAQAEPERQQPGRAPGKRLGG